MLRQNGDDHGRILRALALVHGRCVGRKQRVERPEAVGDDPPVEACRQLVRLRVDVLDIADVTVVDVLVVIPAAIGKDQPGFFRRGVDPAPACVSAAVLPALRAAIPDLSLRPSQRSRRLGEREGITAQSDKYIFNS